MNIAMMAALLEEVDGLLARIELTNTLPFAHRAPHYAALARHAIETALADVSVPLANCMPLKILRAIANTTSAMTMADAVTSGNVECVHLLLDDGVDNDLFGLACKKGQTEIVRLMLSNGKFAYNSAFQDACFFGHEEIARMLIERGVDPSAQNNSAIESAIEGYNMNIVRLLADVLPEKDLNNALCFACGSGHMEIVRLLLDLPPERGVNPAANENAALRIACDVGRTEIVRLLLNLPLEKGVDPAALENTAIRQACTNGHIGVVRLLLDLPLERGVHPGNQSLREARHNKHAHIVRLLLNLPPERGIDADDADDAESVDDVYWGAGGLGLGSDDEW